MNTDILGISELKWTGMDEFNSDDHYIYYCVQEFPRLVKLQLADRCISFGFYNHGNKRLVREDIPENDMILTLELMFL